ncbi:WW domain-containing protein [Colletotrichum higginsianum]|nr:WW domain-containing protein [Colletotrichum higginsianum]
MAGPTSPGAEGPTFAPPHLPAGWIAQWDGSSKKYYFVQLSTGVSQWETPTDAAPTGATPAQPSDHPYGVPQPEVITHPDGSQTVRHADGTLEPVNPSLPPDTTSTRGIDGPSGDRGLGSMAMNALLGGKNSNHGSSSGNQSSSSPLGGLASQLMSGIGGHGNSQGGSSSGGKSSLGKIGSSLASSLLSSGSKPQQGQQQSYHGNQSSGHQQQHGGLAGSLMGGVANMFGSGKQNHGGNDFGYSNNASGGGGGGGGGGGYTGQAPPTSYQPPGSSSHNQHSYGAPSSHQHQQQQPQYGGYNPATYSSGASQGPQTGGYPGQASYGSNPSQQTPSYGNHY